jgi:hypothetical protein
MDFERCTPQRGVATAPDSFCSTCLAPFIILVEVELLRFSTPPIEFLVCVLAGDACNVAPYLCFHGCWIIRGAGLTSIQRLRKS